ncbi:hypothetical protein TFLX_01707 [Thermoflexales bacterium]|nr:hypothetical protein TFLX_01707 [Thermoflexales bacterium]
MAVIYQNDLSEMRDLFLGHGEAEAVVWQGRRALKLNGLVILPDLVLTEGHVEVQIGADGAAYPGIAYRVADKSNYELAYAQPHTSGLWDALQYDPVFHHCNTWQLYHGPAYQQAAKVPTGAWFKFSIDFQDQRAVVRAGDQAPLLLNRSAHTHRDGLIGLWTYLPAHYCDLRVTTLEHDLPPAAPDQPIDPGNIDAWFVEGFGSIACEPTGILNLNRYLPLSVGEVRLSRWIDVTAADSIELDVGFSDELTLQIDDQVIFTGRNVFQSLSANWATRGYVEPTTHLRQALTPGRHRLTAILKNTEYFGWGLIVNVHGGNFKLSPAGLG